MDLRGDESARGVFGTGGEMRRRFVRISWGRGVRREKLGWGLVEGEVRGEGAELFRHGLVQSHFQESSSTRGR